MRDIETKPRLSWALAEVSQLTGLSVGFLRNDVRSGRLPIRRFGRRIVVLDQDLEHYLDNGEHKRKLDLLALQKD